MASSQSLSADQASLLAMFSRMSLEERSDILPLLQDHAMANGEASGGKASLKPSAPPAPSGEGERVCPVGPGDATPSVLVDSPAFWMSVDAQSPLLSRNDCVNATTFAEHQRRVESWADMLKAPPINAADTVVDRVKPETLRVLQKDAERTMSSDLRRKAFVDTLCLVDKQVQDYHQGGGFITAFLCLFLKKEEVARIMWFLHGSPRYHAGYYKAEPHMFALEAQTMHELIKEYVPKVGVHLESIGFIKQNASMYCVKWFVGLGVHMLPYSMLFDFMEAFFVHGSAFLYRFSVVYMDILKDRILALRNLQEVNMLLRNEGRDHKKAHLEIAQWPELALFRAVIERALFFDLDGGRPGWFDQFRTDQHAKVAQVFQAAKAKMAALADSDDEIVFSDED